MAADPAGVSDRSSAVPQGPVSDVADACAAVITGLPEALVGDDATDEDVGSGDDAEDATAAEAGTAAAAECCVGGGREGVRGLVADDVVADVEAIAVASPGGVAGDDVVCGGGREGVRGLVVDESVAGVEETAVALADGVVDDKGRDGTRAFVAAGVEEIMESDVVVAGAVELAAWGDGR
jgi:hypothetical protein